MKMGIKKFRKLLKLNRCKVIILLISGILVFSSCNIKSGGLTSGIPDEALLNEEEIR